MSVKEWIKEEQGKHFCHCGCGKEIKILERHHSESIPKYIHGHNKTITNRTRHVNAWIKKEQGNHFCHCGCRGEIKILRRHHFKGIPKYIIGHNVTNTGKRFSRVKEWIDDEQGKHFCHCGCGGAIEIKKHHHSKGIPKYINRHNRRGTMHTDETKQKIREKRKYQITTEETKEKMSEGRKGEKHWNYGKHHSEGTKRKMREKRKHRKFPKHRTKPELIFEEICQKYNLHFKYTGDGSLWIGKDRAMNPDFIQADGKKIVVEIMGEWWHSPILNPRTPAYANLNYRKKHYKKYGWISYFIWETDLLRPDAEQFVLNMLKGVGIPK